jgi:hypothetical protein
VKGQRIHDFRALLKYFFLAENRAETAPRAAGMAVFAPFCWERTLQPPGNFSEKSDFRRNGDAQVGFMP